MNKKTWTRGDKTKLAEAIGISPQRLSNILSGRARATPEQALKLETEAIRLGYQVSRLDWIYSKETSNPLFASQDEVAHADE
jgi:transcriptional regulator with XRE-family HTH domain